MRTDYKKLISNTGMLAAGNFASSLLGMFMVPFYTSVLTTSEYGVSDLITVTTALLFPFVSLAISESIMRFALDKNTDHRSIYSVGIYTVLLGSFLFFLFYPFIKKTSIGEYTPFFMVYFISFCIHTITVYFAKGLNQIKKYSIAGLITSFVFIVCNLLFLLVLKTGIEGYLLSYIISQWCSTLYLFFGCKLYKYLIKVSAIDQNLVRKMIVYSLPIIPNSISWWISNSSDKYVLNYYKGLSEVGIYSVSYKIPTIMLTIMGFFISAWQISSVDDFGTEKSKKFFSDVNGKIVYTSALVASCLIITSKIFAGFLYSKDFFEAWIYVPMLVMANVFCVMSSFIGSIYTASKQTKMLSVSTVAGALLNIILNFALIPYIGVMGAALSTFISYLIIYVIRIINTRQILTYDVDFKTQFLLFGLMFMMSICVIADSTIGWICSILIFVLQLILSRKFLNQFYCIIYNMISSKISR